MLHHYPFDCKFETTDPPKCCCLNLVKKAKYLRKSLPPDFVAAAELRGARGGAAREGALGGRAEGLGGGGEGGEDGEDRCGEDHHRGQTSFVAISLRRLIFSERKNLEET
jgi:hypothetical protein